MIKTEDIYKYNDIVKEKYPLSIIRRRSQQMIVWINNGIRVAELEEVGGETALRFRIDEPKNSFNTNPMSDLL